MNDCYVPSKLSIELTDQCNLKCLHCFRNSSIGKNKTYISMQCFSSILEKCVHANVKHISYTGGEPFFNNRIFEMIEKTSYYKISFSISTNGYRNLNDYTDFFILHRPSSIQVSLDGDERTHNHIRKNNNAYQHLCDFLNWATRLGIKCKIQFTAMPDNIEAMESLPKFLKKYSINSLHIAVVLPVGRYNTMATLTYDQLVYVNAMKEDLKKRSGINITSTIFNKNNLHHYIEECKRDLYYFILPIIKQNGYLHPYWGLNEKWDIHSAQNIGIAFNGILLETSYKVLQETIQESMRILQDHEIIDFNSVIYNNYNKIEGEISQCQ